MRIAGHTLQKCGQFCDEVKIALKEGIISLPRHLSLSLAQETRDNRIDFPISSVCDSQGVVHCMQAYGQADYVSDYLQWPLQSKLNPQRVLKKMKEVVNFISNQESGENIESETTDNFYEELLVKDSKFEGRYMVGSKSPDNEYGSLLVATIEAIAANFNGGELKYQLNLAYDFVGGKTSSGDFDTTSRSVAQRDPKLTRMAHLKTIQKIRPMLRDIANTLSNMTIRSEDVTSCNEPRGFASSQSEVGETSNSENWENSDEALGLKANVPIHAEIIQHISEDHESDIYLIDRSLNNRSRSKFKGYFDQGEEGYSSVLESTGPRSGGETALKLRCHDGHVAVGVLDLNHSNSQPCGYQRSYLGGLHFPRATPCCTHNSGYRAQQHPDPSGPPNNVGESNSTIENRRMHLPTCPLSQQKEYTKEEDLKKVVASCIRRFTLEESKALATSSSIFPSNIISSDQNFQETVKALASFPCRRVNSTPQVTEQPPEGQTDVSLKPPCASKRGINYPRIRQSESPMADVLNEQDQGVSQGAEAYRPINSSSDNYSGPRPEPYEFAYPKSHSPRSLNTQKPDRQSPCRIAITGCERPVQSGYYSHKPLRPNMDSASRVENGSLDPKVCGENKRSTSNLYSAEENGDYGGSSQPIGYTSSTGRGQITNGDLGQTSSFGPTSPTPKWSIPESKEGLYDRPRIDRSQEYSNEAQSVPRRAENCTKSSGAYQLQYRQTENDGGNTLLTSDIPDCQLRKPSQPEFRDWGVQSPDESEFRLFHKPSGSQCPEMSVHSILDDSREDLRNYYANDSRVPVAPQDGDIVGQRGIPRRSLDDSSTAKMVRPQKHYSSYPSEGMEETRSRSKPHHRCVQKKEYDREATPSQCGGSRISERPRFPPRAHSEECPPYRRIHKKPSTLRRKRSRKRCIPRRASIQKYPIRPRKVAKVSRRASLELERRYGNQISRSESSLACETGKSNRSFATKRSYSQAESPRHDEDIMSCESMKCLCRPAPKCVMVSPCYRNNRAAFLRQKFNIARIAEEGDPCVCGALGAGTPVGLDTSPTRCSLTSAGREDKPINRCTEKGEEEKVGRGEGEAEGKDGKEPYFALRIPCSRNQNEEPRGMANLESSAQSRAYEIAVKKNSSTGDSSCFSIDLNGGKILLKNLDNVAECGTSELQVSDNICERNAANNEISIALGERTIIIKKPGSTSRICVQQPADKCSSDSLSQSCSSCKSPVKGHGGRSSCRRKRKPAAVKRRSTPVKPCTLDEAPTCVSPNGIKPSVCMPTVCVALDYMPNVCEPPQKMPVRRPCTPKASARVVKCSGPCACSQISNGAMPCSKRPITTKPFETPCYSRPPSPLRQWNTPQMHQPASQPCFSLKPMPSNKAYSDTTPNVPLKGAGEACRSCKTSAASDKGGRKSPVEPSVKNGASKRECVGDTDGKVKGQEKYTQCAEEEAPPKKEGFFARIKQKMRNAFRKNRGQTAAQNQTDGEMKEDQDDSKGLPVKDTTSCTLDYNASHSYNCSACSTSRCVSNQSHSFMDLPEEVTANYQNPMRSWNNTIIESHAKGRKVEEFFLEALRHRCKSVNYCCDIKRPQSGEKYSNKPFTRGIRGNVKAPGFLKLSYSSTVDAPVKKNGGPSHLALKSDRPSNKGVGEEPMSEANVRPKCGRSSRTGYFPSLLNTRVKLSPDGHPESCEKLQNNNIFFGSQIALDVCEKDFNVTDETEVITVNNNCPSRQNDSINYSRTMRPEALNLDGKQITALPWFTRNPSPQGMEESSKIPSYQRALSVKEDYNGSKSPNPRLFQTVEGSYNEALAVYKPSLTRTSGSEKMENPNSPCQPALRRPKTGSPSMIMNGVKAFSQEPSPLTPYKMSLDARPSEGNLKNIVKSGFNPLDSTNDIARGNLEKAVLSGRHNDLANSGICHAHPLAQIPSTESKIEPMITSSGGLARSPSYNLLSQSTLTTKPAFLPRNSAPSLHVDRPSGLIASSIIRPTSNVAFLPSKVCPDNQAITLHCRKSGQGNFPKGDNCKLGMSILHENNIPPPLPCQRTYSDIANIHRRVTETTNLKLEREAMEERFFSPCQWSRRCFQGRPAQKCCLTNASSECRTAGSWGLPGPREGTYIMSTKEKVQKPIHIQVPKQFSNWLQPGALHPNSSVNVVAPPGLHGSPPLNMSPAGENMVCEGNRTSNSALLTVMRQKMELFKSPQSFQADGKVFKVRVDKKGVFCVEEVKTPTATTVGEALRPPLGVIPERTSCLSASVNANDRVGEKLSSPLSNEEPAGCVDESNKCPTVHMKNAAIREKLKCSIKMLSGKLVPRYTCQAVDTVENSDAVEEERNGRNDCVVIMPPTAFEYTAEADTKQNSTAIQPSSGGSLQTKHTSEMSIIPCNQNDHQAVLDYYGWLPRRKSTTTSQQPLRGVNVAVGSSYTDVLAISSLTSDKGGQTDSNEDSDFTNAFLNPYQSTYIPTDYVSLASTGADEGCLLKETLESYPQTRNSTLFSYDLRSDSETSLKTFAYIGIKKTSRKQVGSMMVSSRPAVDKSGVFGQTFSEESSHLRATKTIPTIRSNSAPLTTRRRTSPACLCFYQDGTEPTMSISDTDIIIESPFNEDYIEIPGNTEARSHADLTNRNNSARRESSHSRKHVSHKSLRYRGEQPRFREKYGLKGQRFSNQNSYFGTCYEQMVHPRMTSQRSPYLLSLPNDALVRGDIKTAKLMERPTGDEMEKVDVAPSCLKKAEEGEGEDDTSTKSINENSCDSQTEDASLRSATLTLLLEGLCSTSRGGTDARESTLGASPQRTIKSKKHRHGNEAQRNVSRLKNYEQKGSIERPFEASMFRCPDFKENKAFTLRKKHNWHSSGIRCAACLMRKQNLTYAKPQMHFFAKGVLKRPFCRLKLHNKGRQTKGHLSRRSGQASRKVGIKKGGRGKLGVNRCFSHISKPLKSSSRQRIQSQTPSHCNRSYSLGVDANMCPPSVSSKSYSLEVLEPSVNMEHANSDPIRCKLDSWVDNSKAFGQFTEASATLKRNTSVSRESNEKMCPTFYPRPRGLSGSLAAGTDDETGALDNLTTSKIPNSLTCNIMGTGKGLPHEITKTKEFLRMRNTVRRWNTGDSTPPLLIVPSSGSEENESSYVFPQHWTS